MLFKLKMKFDCFRIKELKRLLKHWEDVKRVRLEKDLKLIVLKFDGYQIDDYKITAIHRINDLNWLKKQLNRFNQFSDRYIHHALLTRIYILET